MLNAGVCRWNKFRQLLSAAETGQSERTGLRMPKKTYPTNFFIGLDDRLIKVVGLGSSMELTVLSAIRCLCLDDEAVQEVGASYKEIKLSIDCSHENLSKSLKSLQRKGLVTRRQDHNDRRVVRYWMTSSAWKMIAAADNYIAQEVMRFVIDGAIPESADVSSMKLARVAE